MFDQRVEAAWRGFHERLVGIIEGWDRDDVLGIWLGFASTDVEGDLPFVEVDVVGRDVLVHVASNLTLAQE